MTNRLRRRHLLRKTWAHFGRNDKSETDGDEKKRKELTARKSGDERCVRLPEIFHHDSENRVAEKKETGQDAVWLSRPRPHQPQNGEQEDAFKKRFVDLGRMTRRQNRAQNVSH